VGLERVELVFRVQRLMVEHLVRLILAMVVQAQSTESLDRAALVLSLSATQFKEKPCLILLR
jgi:hypothetical protein